MKHIVTDMGGVIIDLYWTEFVQKIIGQKYEIDELIQLWMRGKSTNDYETGKQKNFDKFIQHFLTEFNVKISHEEMRQYFLGVIGAPQKDFFKIFEEFKRQGYCLSVLSNTNPAHVAFLTEKYDLFRLFDYKFFSHEIGYMKPDKRIYEYVIKKLGISPSDIYFFDDAKTNVDGARTLGINAFQVTSPQEIFEALEAARFV